MIYLALRALGIFSAKCHMQSVTMLTLVLGIAPYESHVNITCL